MNCGKIFINLGKILWIVRKFYESWEYFMMIMQIPEMIIDHLQIPILPCMDSHTLSFLFYVLFFFWYISGHRGKVLWIVRKFYGSWENFMNNGKILWIVEKFYELQIPEMIIDHTQIPILPRMDSHTLPYLALPIHWTSWHLYVFGEY